MTLTALYPPIAAATVLNCFLFAAAWRAYQQERQGRDLPWWFMPGFLVYAGGAGALFYLADGRPLTSSLGYFGAAMVGEAMGVVIVGAVLEAFVLSRGRPWQQRVAPMGAAVFLMILAVAGALKG